MQTHSPPFLFSRSGGLHKRSALPVKEQKHACNDKAERFAQCRGIPDASPAQERRKAHQGNRNRYKPAERAMVIAGTGSAMAVKYPALSTLNPSTRNVKENARSAPTV